MEEVTTSQNKVETIIPQLGDQDDGADNESSANHWVISKEPNVKSKRRKSKTKPTPQEILGWDEDREKEAQLEELVFGGEERVRAALDQRSALTADEEPAAKTRKPAWEDDDDEAVESLMQEKGSKGKRFRNMRSAKDYSENIKYKFISVMGTHNWANLDHQKKKDEDDLSDPEDLDLVQTARNFTGRSQYLPKGQLDYKQCRDLNFEGRAEQLSARCLEFHPSSQVALVAGQAGVTSLFQVDGKTNPKIQSVKFERFSIHSAHFSADGSELVASSADYNLYYYVYDLMSGRIVQIPTYNVTQLDNLRTFAVSPDGKFLAFYGRTGYISLFSGKNKEWITNLKMNGEVTSVTFSTDGSRMFSHGDEGQVYVWDMNSRQCIHKFYDDGCIKGTSIAFSNNGQFLACGSNSGVVNIYDTCSLLAQISPRPLKTVLNLTTAVTQLQFNSSTELLAMLSSDKENAVKLLHFPSMTVFENFPQFKLNMMKPQCLDLSLNSGYLTISNNKGRAYLWRLRHYSNY